MKLKISKLDNTSLPLARKLFSVLSSVFETSSQPTDQQIKAIISSPHFIGMAAINADNVVGGLTAYLLPVYHSKKSEVYLYDIGVLPAYQRQGIGEALLTALKDYAKELGAGLIYVQADVDDLHALDFYRTTGGSEAQVRHFTFEV